MMALNLLHLPRAEVITKGKLRVHFYLLNVHKWRKQGILNVDLLDSLKNLKESYFRDSLFPNCTVPEKILIIFFLSVRYDFFKDPQSLSSKYSSTFIMRFLPFVVKRCIRRASQFIFDIFSQILWVLRTHVVESFVQFSAVSVFIKGETGKTLYARRIAQ